MSPQTHTETSVPITPGAPLADRRPSATATESAPLLDAARALRPFLREHSQSIEANRRLPEAVIDALRRGGFFRLLLPRAVGGLETDPVSFALATEEIARGDSAAAWSMQAGNTGAWWSARLPDEGVAEIYASNPSALVAAAFHPPQRAIPVEEGYRVTGRGPLASNIHDSEWLFLTAIVMQGAEPRITAAGTPEIVGLVLKASDATIVDTWDSLGMRGTDSNDVAVDEVFVPWRRSFPVTPTFEPSRRYQGALYRFPAIGITGLNVTPVALAVARGAIDELRELAGRKTAFGFNKSLRDRTVVQSTLAKGEAFLRSARLLFYDTVGAVWDRMLAGESLSLEQRADLLLAGVHAVSTAATVTTMMHRLAGTSGIYASNRLERHFRDASTLRHHGFVSENRLEAVGQVYLGVQPEFMMMGF